VRIQFTYGTDQVFRRRTDDLNLVGNLEGARYPLDYSTWSLNGGPEIFVYVEHVADPGIDWTYEYKDSIAVNRLKDTGDFNIEIPVTSPDLRSGNNTLRFRVNDDVSNETETTVEFTFDPTSLATSLDLSDLSRFEHIQEVGQITNGAFDLDKNLNVIRNRGPVYPDSLLVVGSKHGSQRATYDVRFTDFAKVKWLGPSDYFTGHAGPEPPIGIKPGWSSAGLVALNPRNEARMFLAYGDHVGTDEEWVVQTAPPVRFCPEPGTWYSVRHEVLFRDGVNSARFKIWPRAEGEPTDWLLEESDYGVAEYSHRHRKASFGLFQHSGMPNEWSNIRIHALE